MKIIQRKIIYRKIIKRTLIHRKMIHRMNSEFNIDISDSIEYRYIYDSYLICNTLITKIFYENNYNTNSIIYLHYRSL